MLIGFVSQGEHTLNKRWAHLNIATLFVKILHSNANDPAWAPESNKFRGRSGTSIVFSCTWNENKKNDIDEVNKAHGRIGNVHVCDFSFLSFPFSTAPLALYAPYKRYKTPGKNPSAVNTAESLINAACENQVRHLKTTFEAHQKFATLSSKIPRAKGNIRVMGLRMALRGANGGRKGRKSRVKEAIVVIPRRVKCRTLLSGEQEKLGGIPQQLTRPSIRDIYTFQVGMNQSPVHNTEPSA